MGYYEFTGVPGPLVDQLINNGNSKDFDELNECASSSNPESGEFNACSGLDGLDKSNIGSSTAISLVRPVQMTTGDQS